jgi:hypothetical protein
MTLLLIVLAGEFERECTFSTGRFPSRISALLSRLRFASRISTLDPPFMAESATSSSWVSMAGDGLKMIFLSF